MKMRRAILFFILMIDSHLATIYCAESNPFKHPGILVSKSMLDLVKIKLKAGTEPWKTAYKHMLEPSLQKESSGTRERIVASLSFDPKLRKIVDCGGSSNPDHGCWDEIDSSLSAYTHALIWSYTGNITHANKAIEIMDAWASILTGHNGSNHLLQTGWAGSVWPRAADIIKHTNSSWSLEKQKSFEEMLKKAYLPDIHNGLIAGVANWHMTMVEATAAISVFLDDHVLFNHAITMWRNRVPGHIYLKTDGPHPLSDKSIKARTGDDLIKFWYGAKSYADGMSQETCRDLGHASMGIGSLINIAEIAWHQGVDLYKEEHDRIVRSLEFHANFILGAPVPKWLCGGKLTHGNDYEGNAWEIGYNHYHNRIGVDMPFSHTLVMKARPTGSHLFWAWETLTHGDNPTK